MVNFMRNNSSSLHKLSLRCYDDYGQNKIIQINGSKENLSFIHRLNNTMCKWKGMKI